MTRTYQRDEASPQVVIDAQQLTVKLQKAEGAQATRLRGRLGDTLRVLGDVDEAIDLLERAHHDALKEGAEDAALTHALRLAIALQYAGQFRKALTLFEKVEMEMSAMDHPLIHFAWQHWGKCLVETGRIKEAGVLLNRALAARRAPGHEDWLESTRRALAGLEEFES